MAKTTDDVVAQVLTILAKAESAWDLRLTAEKSEKQVPTTLTVTRQYVSHGQASGPPEVKEDTTLAVHRYLTAPAHVNAEIGLTINIGNFESVRVHVGVTVPCYKEEVEDCYQWAKEFVEAKVKAEAADVRATANAGKTQNQPF